MKTYKGIPNKLNVIAENTINGITKVLVNGYKDSCKIVGYSNTNVFNGNFISYTSTQFKCQVKAKEWLNN